MKSIIRISLLLLATLILLSLSGCAGITTDNGLVLGQSYQLASGQTLNNDMTIVGGNAQFAQGSTVNGNVAVIGGNVTLDGVINGDVSVLGGYVTLDDQADIKGSLNTLGGTVQRSSQARVEGQTHNNNRAPYTTIMPSPGVNISFEPITAVLTAIFQALALAALAILANLFITGPMVRVGRSAIAQPAATGGVGCLTLLVLVIMAITIILLPISILGFMIAGVAILFGWLALGLMVGRRIATWLNQPWTDPVNAGVGTLVLTLLASLLNIIPCIGWLGSFILAMIALGTVVLTRFGTQQYPVEGYGLSTPRPGPYTPSAPYTQTPMPPSNTEGPPSHPEE